jgi:hypothetical protein
MNNAGLTQKLGVVGGALLLCITAGAAKAATYPGNLAVFTSSGTNVRDLFEVANGGTTIEINGEAPNAPNGNANWFLDGVQIVGIRSLFLVDASGANPAPVSGVNFNSAYVKKDSGAASQFNWITKTGDGYKIFDDGASGFGFKDGSHFLVVSNDGGLTSAGKNPSKNTDRFGSFNFGSSIVDTDNSFKYDIGLDWMGANGQTQRSYFSIPQSVPEPPFYQMGSLLGLGAIGWIRIRRRNRTAN